MEDSGMRQKRNEADGAGETCDLRVYDVLVTCDRSLYSHSVSYDQ